MFWGWNAQSKTQSKVYTVNNTEQSFKSGIPKNDRKIDITFYFLALKKGLVVRGQTRSYNHFWRLLKKLYHP